MEFRKKFHVKLLLIGDGPDRFKAETLTKKLDISDKVYFLGNSTEVRKILCYTDIFLLPSQTESFGLAALEAMAGKSAIISTNAGGLPEVNIHGKTGFLSDVGDVDDMILNSLKILKDKKTLESFKLNAYKHAKSFSLENIVPVYEDIYNNCLKVKV